MSSSRVSSNDSSDPAASVTSLSLFPLPALTRTTQRHMIFSCMSPRNGMAILLRERAHLPGCFLVRESREPGMLSVDAITNNGNEKHLRFQLTAVHRGQLLWTCVPAANIAAAHQRQRAGLAIAVNTTNVNDPQIIASLRTLLRTLGFNLDKLVLASEQQASQVYLGYVNDGDGSDPEDSIESPHL